mgnify:FL=1
MFDSNFPPNIDPQSFSLLAIAVGAAVVGDLNANEQNSVGNWLELVGQYILTHAAHQQLIESRIENFNININSQKSKSGNGPFVNGDKSNQTQRAEVDYLLDVLAKMQEELKNYKN